MQETNSPVTKTSETEWLRKRLDVIIQLLLESSPGGAASVTKKIERLLAMGFSQSEVAQVIGKRTNYVTAIVSGLKSASAKSKKTKSPKKPAGPLPLAPQSDQPPKDQE